MIAPLGLALALTLQCPTTTPAPRLLTVVQGETMTSEYEHDLWMEYAQLINTHSRTATQEARLAAIAATLGTIPGRCTKQQAQAGLCIRVEDLQRH